MDPVVLGLTITIIIIMVLINALVYGARLKADTVIIQAKDELKNAGEKILLKDNSAAFFGIKSLGGGQIRGQGFLVLTDKRVYFSRYFPQKIVNIPVESIKGTEMVQTYLGKNTYMPVLKILFGQDEVAFAVKEPDLWIEQLDGFKKLMNI